MGAGRLHARTRLIVIAALGLVVAAAAALILGGEVSGSRAGAAAKRSGSGSATVARRDLIATDTESGTLSYADARTVFNRLSGTITSLPAAGTVVRPGGVLFTVDNSPVILMDGTLPAYRSLSAGVADGPDVRELEQNLVALGYDPTHSMTVDDHFDAATTAAVERWQGATSQTQTGTVTLGQVVFMPGARRVSAVSAALGSTGGSGAASAGSATGASLRLPSGAGHAEFVGLTTTTTTSTSTTTSSSTTTTTTHPARPAPGQAPPAQGGASTPTLLALVALLRAEVAELKAARGSASAGSAAGRSSTTGAGATGTTAGTRSAGASGAIASASSAGVAGASAAGGSSSAGGAAAAQAVLSTTSTQLVATVPLDATKQSEAVQGAPVTVQMPDGSTVDGRISQVAAAAQTASSSASGGSASGSGSAGGSGSGSGASSTVPVTITLRGHVRSAGLDQAAVSVNFEQQKALGVLSVPVTALLATAGGGYAIQPVDQPQHLIPVTPGLFAAGYVQISGSGVLPGLAITDSQG